MEGLLGGNRRPSLTLSFACVFGLYRDNGKENGTYHIIMWLYWGYILYGKQSEGS